MLLVENYKKNVLKEVSNLKPLKYFNAKQWAAEIF